MVSHKQIFDAGFVDDGAAIDGLARSIPMIPQLSGALLSEPYARNCACVLAEPADRALRGQVWTDTSSDS